ncbi:MAG: RluA family pseudouridine synthase [Spirochaetes bacterium]|jgi:23S rRNA pseudouridine1911/1915/1917 synthase|nr:RluA family pseudouridine synthase [Spirochaetota bacterium]
MNEDDINYLSGRLEFTVSEEFGGERTDRFLASVLENGISRSYIQKLIKAGRVLANGGLIKQNHRLSAEDVVTIEIPSPEKLELMPEDIPIEVVYEDRSLLVVNKQAGLVVHPGPGNWNNTLVNALLYSVRDLSGIGGVERPGIVHRLDKDTSGLMVIAKNDAAHRSLVEAFAGRRVEKKYSAIVSGKPPKEHAVIDLPIARHRKYGHKMTVTGDGREAVSEYFLKKMWNTTRGIFSLLDVVLHTGRTHQIRVHLSASGMPIVGDPIYSKKSDKYGVPFLLLASVSLAFDHPEDGRRMSFTADLPPHMSEFIVKLEKIRIC